MREAIPLATMAGRGREAAAQPPQQPRRQPVGHLRAHDAALAELDTGIVFFLSAGAHRDGRLDDF